ncbi:uncharacterized protein L201_003988 [Kwoniella dendrophila CBS 6074]|uniref:Transcription factor domain-containing protein n=1 Tax=Kwoniella dendrophila CBS 6074 TaxID=1295534 RepID=A0AAX4JX17_9TREE
MRSADGHVEESTVDEQDIERVPISLDTSQNGQDDKSTLMHIEQRTAKMENMLVQLLHRQSVPNQLRTANSETKDDRFGSIRYDQRNQHWSGSIWQILGGIGQARECILIDPVEAGLVTQLDMNRRLDNVLQSLSNSILFHTQLKHSDIETNPLFRCVAMRLDPPKALQSRLDSMIHQNIFTVCSMPPNRQNLIALLILLRIPPSPHAIQIKKPFDPYNVSGHILNMAIALGLDEKVERLKQEDTMNLTEDWTQPLLFDVFLWYSSLQQSQIYTFFASTSCSLHIGTYTPAFRFKDVISLDLATSLDQSLHHLWLESELYEIFYPISTALRTLRVSRIYEDSQTKSIIDAADDLCESLRSWRDRVTESTLSTSNYLYILSLQMESAIYLRASTEAGPNLPSPLGHDIRSPPIPLLGNKFVRCTLETIEFMLNWNIPAEKLPCWNFIMSFLPYATLKSIQQLHSQEEVSFDFSLLKKYRKYLIDSHPASLGIIQSIDKIKTDPTWKDHSNSTDPPSQDELLGADLFNCLPTDSEWWASFNWLQSLEG